MEETNKDLSFLNSLIFFQGIHSFVALQFFAFS